MTEALEDMSRGNAGCLRCYGDTNESLKEASWFHCSGVIPAKC